MPALTNREERAKKKASCFHLEFLSDIKVRTVVVVVYDILKGSEMLLCEKSLRIPSWSSPLVQCTLVLESTQTQSLSKMPQLLSSLLYNYTVGKNCPEKLPKSKVNEVFFHLIYKYICYTQMEWFNTLHSNTLLPTVYCSAKGSVESSRHIAPNIINVRHNKTRGGKPKKQKPICKPL